MRKVAIAILTLVISYGAYSSNLAFSHDACCKPAPVCCPPPPVEVVLCVKDPCTGCVTEECVCIPACCAHETPCMTWRNGLLGRKILTYKWECCDHCVDVVITRHGKVIVHD